MSAWADSNDPITPRSVAVIGLYLVRTRDFPTVASTMPFSPAARSGVLKRGVTIVAISPNGEESSFVSTQFLSLAELDSMLIGKPGSIVSLTVLTDALVQTNQQIVVRLARAEVLRFSVRNDNALDGTYDCDVSRGTIASMITNQMSNLQHVTHEHWSRITNGMSSSDVIKTIGSPVLLENSYGESGLIAAWTYGCQYGSSLDSKSPCISFTELLFKRDKVIKGFGIKQPSGSDVHVDILSMKAIPKRAD